MPYVLLLLLQSAAMRPTARYLQQHRFVNQRPPASAACLSGLLQQVQVYLSQKTSPAPTLLAAGARGGARAAVTEMAGGATGHFSWRGPKGEGFRDVLCVIDIIIFLRIDLLCLSR